MSQLSALRGQLAALRRWRATLAFAAVVCTALVAVLWTLVGVFLVDWCFSVPVNLRVWVLLLGGGVFLWSLWQFALPLMGPQETDLDMALLVEEQHKIDNDLIAALQFEEDTQPSGSPQLRQAVIDYVAEAGGSWNVFAGLSSQTLVRRAQALAITAVLLVVGVVLFPEHAAAFGNRLLLGHKHYPTDTIIQNVQVNGTATYDHGRPLDVRTRSPQGLPVTFAVTASGVLPSNGQVRLQNANGQSTNLPLAAVGRSQNGTGQFASELPRLMEEVDYQIFLGDAWTDPQPLGLIARPLVTLTFQPQLPSYAGGGQTDPVTARSFSVLEGSQVGLIVKSTKPLGSVDLIIDETTYPLVPTQEEGTIWRLPPSLPKPHPLQNIVKPLRYQVNVVDNDGLSPESALEGFIRLKADRPPTAAAGVLANIEFVVPGATPVITYSARDDYGLKRLRLKRQIKRKANQDGSGGDLEEASIELPVPPGVRTISQEQKLDFSSWNLSKGDQVRLILEATDERGQNPGQTTESERLTLYVTDEQGVLAALAEQDKESYDRLDEIIQRELGIGK